MYAEQYLIDRIKEQTPYEDVQLAEDSAIDLIHQPLLAPRIFVGHLGIQLQFPEDRFANGYRELENQELLITAIQFICAREDLAEVRTNLKNAYTGYSPFEGDSNYSSLTFLEASMIGKTSTKSWWQELVGLVMPRIS